MENDAFCSYPGKTRITIKRELDQKILAGPRPSELNFTGFTQWFTHIFPIAFLREKPLAGVFPLRAISDVENQRENPTYRKIASTQTFNNPYTPLTPYLLLIYF